MESAVGGGVCVCMVTSYTLVKCYAAFVLLTGMSNF
jgi:hypothetical protein